MANKPAGLRTFAFVSLGSTIFTIASSLIGPSNGDTGRVAAQIVTGIGFIGAGAVFRSGKYVSGLTTAAGIWATAAIGMVFGLGYLIFGLCIAFLVIGLFWLHSIIEMRTMGKCEFRDVHIHVDDVKGKNSILFEEIISSSNLYGAHIETIELSNLETSYKVRYCSKHKVHRSFLSEIAACPFVNSIKREDGSCNI